ncbi:MAG: hypothetical protein EAZ07_04670 [Cytophagales bacterium]|nr:MAG: hypothetical protein EAZ07_04670 [Cytophagales bacterium]
MTRGKIKEIMSIFQDSNLEELTFIDSNLNFRIKCEFLAQLIDKNYKYFYGVFKNCMDVYFQPWDEENFHIVDVNEISKLELELLNVELADNGYIKIYVNCNQRFPGGNWLIQCKDLIIFDEDLREMNLLQLIELSEKYWYLSDKAEG